MTESGSLKINKLTVNFSSLKGNRKTMEDYFIVDQYDIIKDHQLFAIFDGHGGSECAKFMKENLLNVFYSHSEINEYINALDDVDPEFFSTILFFYEIDFQRVFNEVLQKLDDMYYEYTTKNKYCIPQDGTTVNIIFITPYKIICANLGDSRSILVKIPGIPLRQLSSDHTIEYDSYRLKIVGATISSDNRILSNSGCLLNLSRSLGDYSFKKIFNGKTDDFVSRIPEVRILERSNDDLFIIMACDGLWDVLSNEYVSEYLYKNYASINVAFSLSKEALLRGSTDNITCISIKF